MSLYTPYLHKKLFGTIQKHPDGSFWVFPQYIREDDGTLTPIAGVEEMFPPSGSFRLKLENGAQNDKQGVVRLHLNEEPDCSVTPRVMAFGRQVNIQALPNSLCLCKHCQETSQVILNAGKIGPMGFKTIPYGGWTKHIFLHCADEEELTGPFRITFEKEKGHTFFLLSPPGVEHPFTYTRADLRPLKMPAAGDAAPEACPVSLVAKKTEAEPEPAPTTYVGVAVRAAQGVMLDLQYTMDKHGALRPLKEKMEPQHMPKVPDTFRGIVRLDLDLETGPQLSKFPTEQDAWLHGVERESTAPVKEHSGIGPWGVANPIPPKGGAIVVVSPDAVYGPVIANGLKTEDKHRYLTIRETPETTEEPLDGFEVVRFVKPGSTTAKAYHLVLVRKRPAAAPPAEEQADTPEDEPEAEPEAAVEETPVEAETPAPEAAPEPETAPEQQPKANPISTDAENLRCIVNRLIDLPAAEAEIIFPDYVGAPTTDWRHVGIRTAGAVFDLQEAVAASELQMSQLKSLVKDESVVLWRYMRSRAWDIMGWLKTAFRRMEDHVRRAEEMDADALREAFAGRPDIHWPVLRSLVEALRSQDITYLFEYYCQHRLLQGLMQMGFAPVGEYAATHFNYITPAVGGQPTARANTIRMQRGDCELTFYLTPSIRGEEPFENGLRLFRRDYDHGSAPTPLTPDFVLKLTSGGRSNYVILDAKYAPSKNIDTRLLDAAIAKYYGHIGTWDPQDSIRMVWTLQGRLNTTLPYHGYTPSPLAEAFGGFPSFGNCEVNEQQPGGMEPFWAAFGKLLS